MKSLANLCLQFSVITIVNVNVITAVGLA